MDELKEQLTKRIEASEKFTTMGHVDYINFDVILQNQLVIMKALEELLTNTR